MPSSVIAQYSGISFLIIRFKTCTKTKPSGPRIIRKGRRNLGSKSSSNVNVQRKVSISTTASYSRCRLHNIVHSDRPARIVGDEDDILEVQRVDEARDDLSMKVER